MARMPAAVQEMMGGQPAQGGQPGPQPGPGGMPQPERASAGNLAEPSAGHPSANNGAEIERGANGVAKALYDNPQTSKAILGMVSDKEKVGSTAKASMFLVKQVADKLKLNTRVVPPLLTMTVADVIKFAGKQKGIEYSEQEIQQTYMATWELMFEVYQVPRELRAQISGKLQGADKSQLSRIEEIYKGNLPKDRQEQAGPQAEAQAGSRPAQQGGPQQ